MSIFDEPKTIELIRERICSQCAISRFQAESFGLERSEEMVPNQLVYRLRGYLWAKKHQHHHENRIEIPLTWWDHFKQSWPA